MGHNRSIIILVAMITALKYSTLILISTHANLVHQIVMNVTMLRHVNRVIQRIIGCCLMHRVCQKMGITKQAI